MAKSSKVKANPVDVICKFIYENIKREGVVPWFNEKIHRFPRDMAGGMDMSFLVAMALMSTGRNCQGWMSPSGLREVARGYDPIRNRIREERGNFTRELEPAPTRLDGTIIIPKPSEFRKIGVPVCSYHTRPKEHASDIAKGRAIDFAEYGLGYQAMAYYIDSSMSADTSRWIAYCNPSIFMNIDDIKIHPFENEVDPDSELSRRMRLWNYPFFNNDNVMSCYREPFAENDLYRLTHESAVSNIRQQLSSYAIVTTIGNRFKVMPRKDGTFYMEVPVYATIESGDELLFNYFRELVHFSGHIVKRESYGMNMGEINYETILCDMTAAMILMSNYHTTPPPMEKETLDAVTKAVIEFMEKDGRFMSKFCADATVASTMCYTGNRYMHYYDKESKSVRRVDKRGLFFEKKAEKTITPKYSKAKMAYNDYVTYCTADATTLSTTAVRLANPIPPPPTREEPVDASRETLVRTRRPVLEAGQPVRRAARMPSELSQEVTREINEYFNRIRVGDVPEDGAAVGTTTPETEG
jgi:hypothetical protein